ncbi:O-antigen ligase family protein [Cellulomonas sp.]|uniref:O-antigen ligase family protein n=1 Tax=Cellulomonas sp. TaxID=40001 RepID=UPI003BAAFEEE
MSVEADLGPRRRLRGTNHVDAVTWLTVYIVVLYAIPSRLVVGALGSAGSVSMLFGLASFAVWMLQRVWVWRTRPLRTGPVQAAWWVFVFVAGVSYVMAVSRPISADELSPLDVSMLVLVSWSGTLLVAHDGVRSRERLETLIWRMALCGGVLALLGLAQFATGRTFVDTISVPGLTSVAASGTYYRSGLVRPSGTAIHPIEYGVLITMLLPLALHVAFHHRTRNLFLRCAPALAIGAVIGASSSRSAYLGAATGLAICAVGWSARQRRTVLALGLGGAIVLVAAVPRLTRSIVGLFAGAEEDPSITSRTGSLDMAWWFLSQHPLFGRGLGTFMPKYRIFDNQYLNLLVGVGVVGTIAFVALAVVAVVHLIRTFRAVSEPSARDLTTSLIAAIVTMIVSLAYFDAFAFPMTMGTLFLLLGLAGASRRILHPGSLSTRAAPTAMIDA